MFFTIYIKIFYEMEQYYRISDASKKPLHIKMEEGAFVEMSDGNMIKKDNINKLYKKIEDQQLNESIQNMSLQDDMPVDPSSFFSNTSVDNNMLNKINSIDTSKVSNNPVIPEIKVKTQHIENQTINTNNQSLTQQPITEQKIDPEQKKQEILKIFEDEKMAYGENEAIVRRDKRLIDLYKLENNNPSGNNPSGNNPSENIPINTGNETPNVPISTEMPNPVDIMFRSFKRNHDIEIHLSFKNKIANPDFVKMMMENMDGDIVSFYKKLIMSDIMSNVDHIEKEVEKSINIAIYGEEHLDDNNDIQSEDETSLVKGKITSSGKQTYKYLDSDGVEKEVLPETAKKKGYTPVEK